MAIFKCKMCGGDLDICEGITVAECEYCGTKQTVSKSTNEVITNLFGRANNLRLKCEFDKAEQVYEKILDIDNTEAEAHWGIVLCKYGIEYVDDPKTFKRVPTCHRTLYGAVTADVDYLAAIENADLAQKELYIQEASIIDSLQKNILNIVNREKPFDIFICYKETDENGKRTPDSAIANDIYYQLTQEGFKVFYSAITLEDRLGEEYEPYIFAALNSAKVMLVVGTKPQYFDAVWVRNEWSRFLKLMKTDRSKLLIPCYKDMDAYELPEAFAHLQAQDMGKIGFINDVVRGIKKVISKDEPVTEKETIIKTEPINGNVTAILKRGFLTLEDGDWQRADEFFEQALNFDAELSDAYLGKLMAQIKIKTKDQLSTCEEAFDQNPNYRKAIRFGDESLKTFLENCAETVKKLSAEKFNEDSYQKAKVLLYNGYDIAKLNKAKSIFESIYDYKDSAKLLEECVIKINESKTDAQKQVLYDKAVHSMTLRTIEGYQEAVSNFEKIIDWRDSKERIGICNEEIEILQEEEEIVEREKMQVEATGIVIGIIVLCAFVCLTVLLFSVL